MNFKKIYESVRLQETSFDDLAPIARFLDDQSRKDYSFTAFQNFKKNADKDDFVGKGDQIGKKASYYYAFALAWIELAHDVGQAEVEKKYPGLLEGAKQTYAGKLEALDKNIDHCYQNAITYYSRYYDSSKKDDKTYHGTNIFSGEEEKKHKYPPNDTLVNIGDLGAWGTADGTGRSKEEKKSSKSTKSSSSPVSKLAKPFVDEIAKELDVKVNEIQDIAEKAISEEWIPKLVAAKVETDKYEFVTHADKNKPKVKAIILEAVKKNITSKAEASKAREKELLDLEF